MKRICVFAGSQPGVRPVYTAAAQGLGAALVGRGLGLVYGGGRIGLMGAVADAVLDAGGHVTGVIPQALVAREVAHEGLSDLRVVPSMHVRKAMMAELADGFIALPGGWGTLEELFEVLTWAQLGLHQKPCGVLNVAGYFDGLLAFLDQSVAEGFVRSENHARVVVSEEAGSLLDAFAGYAAPAAGPWLDAAST
ncbi:MAG: TIGR00730 family Rossman fold protein [Acidobacteriota bacterium]